ncbi:tRNA lysidine(34) synthetase TilS [Seminibacterium arietis]|uniref:tRNA(Ile)-lysidine synthase n=1 Tax=Seminibacterium arietis TaxID=1173502 RepID=A0ABW3I780_9PAST
MMTLFNHFVQQVDLYYSKQIRFFIGFSGGLDSTVLVSLFSELQKIRPHIQIKVIHIHHGLSPNADNWAFHCQQVCHNLGLPFEVQRVQVNSKAGLEAGAREARYQAIKEHLPPTAIFVTAHHLQDQTETFFLALKRGSGLQGLGAMQPQSTVFNVPVFRPLLPFSRQQLLEYANKCNLTWIEDESNQNNYYDRNFLRNEILPLLRQRWSHFDQSVQRSAQHCIEQQQLINELLATEFQQRFNKNDRTFDVNGFTPQAKTKQNFLLRQWIAQFNLTMPSVIQLEHINRDVIFADSDRNPTYYLAPYTIRRYQQTLYLTKPFADLRQIRLEIKLDQRITLPDQLGYIKLRKSEPHFIASWTQVNHQQIEHKLPITNQPIEIRFTYAGKVRSKTGINQDIKKCWQQHKIPPWQRQRTPLVFYGNTFIAALGLFEQYITI